MNWTIRSKPLNKTELVFDSTIIDSILNQSNTSLIKKSVFEVLNENSVDIEDNILYNIVKNINKAEDTTYNKFIEKNKLINNKKNSIEKKEKNTSNNKKDKDKDNNNKNNYQKN
jgi:hypothetical protein